MMIWKHKMGRSSNTLSLLRKTPKHSKKNVENESFIGASAEEGIEQVACYQNYLSSPPYHMGGKIGPSWEKIWRNMDMYGFS